MVPLFSGAILRVLPILAIAAVGVAIFALFPRTTETRELSLGCDIPDALAGTQTGPLSAVEGLMCEIVDSTTVERSQFFGASTQATTNGSTSRGSALRLVAFVEDGSASVTPDQLAGCLQSMAEEVATTTQSSARPSPEMDGHFRVSCDFSAGP